MKKSKKTKNKSINHICLPYHDPQLSSDRLETIYGASESHDLIYLDLLDEDTGDVVPILAGVDSSTDPVRLIPLARWMTASDTLNKPWKIWHAQVGEWVPIKETKLTREAWHALKYE